MQKVGFGFDSHRFTAGRPLMLCGIRVEHDRGLAGHSDADVALHALIDALLGAAAAGDIGDNFPDTDEKWKNASSADLVAETMDILARTGLMPVNCDVTIIAEAPRLTPYKVQMTDRLADLLGVDASAVSVKAKTAEGMGLVGAGEGMAAFAVVLVEEAEL